MQRTVGILAHVSRAAPVLRSHVRVNSQLRSFASGGNVWSVLQESVKASNVGEDTAVVSVRQEDSLSHRKLLEVASCFAGGLTNNLGYSPGDKLAVALGNNSLEHVVAHLGASMAGVALVPAKDPSEPHLAGCRGLLVSADVLGERAPQGIIQGEKHPPIVAHDDWGVGSASVALFYDAFVDTRPLDLSAMSASGSDALAYFTPDKATSHQEVLKLAEEASSYLKMQTSDRLCLPIPVAHPFGFGSGVLAVLLAGGTLVLPSSKKIEDILTAIESEECTLVYADSHILKALDGVSPSTETLRGGLCKIGSGTSIGLGEHVAFNGVPLATIGKP